MNKKENSLNNFNIKFKSKLKEKENQNPSVAIYKKERGITLIALVITIVILIILATISINAVLGEEGLIKRAEKAGEHQANAEASDSSAIDEMDKYIGQALGESKEVTLAEAKQNDMLTSKVNAKLTIGEDTVWIPAGFKVHEESASVVDEGIVITDGTNEFVWVPVDNASFNAMFGTAPSEPYYLCGQSGETGVKTSYYSNLRVRSENRYIFAATTPGTTSVLGDDLIRADGAREPDLVIGFAGTTNDASTSKYYEQEDLQVQQQWHKHL